MPFLQRTRRGAFLVNVGRGSVVVEEAVADALDAGQLGGYAADVFAMEVGRTSPETRVESDLMREDKPMAAVDDELVIASGQLILRPVIEEDAYPLANIMPIQWSGQHWARISHLLLNTTYEHPLAPYAPSGER